MTVHITLENETITTVGHVERIGFDGITLYLFQTGVVEVMQFVLCGTVEPSQDELHFMTFSVLQEEK